MADNNLTREVDCAGRTLNVMGNGNTLTLKGCKTVNVNGNDNTLSGAAVTLNVNGNANTVAGVGVTAINVMGRDNKVSWKGKAPHVSNLGQGNEVGKAK